MQKRTPKSKQETKKHDSTSETAPKHAQAPAPTSPKRIDPIPLPEHGGHAHSYAAHLGGAIHGRTAPAANFSQRVSGQLREPPQQISRIGKQHRG
jgi:hypothetical protein